MKRASFVLLGLLLLALVLAEGFSLYARIRTGDVTSHSATATRKAPMHGLVSMGSFAFRNSNDGVPNNSLADIYARPAAFDGVVINLTWAQLEPTRGTFVTTALDQALADVRAYNLKYPDHALAVRLGLFAGEHAPDWAKSIGGTPIPIDKPVGDPAKGGTIPITVGRFWSAPYEQAWTELVQFLASQYDPDPLIREVGFASCSSIDDEPFLDGVVNSRSTRTNLRSAGFTDEAFKNCLESFSDYAAWKNTYVGYAFNPFFDIDSGRPVADEAFTGQVMKKWRQTLGARAVVSNHGLGGPSLPVRTALFSDLQKTGPILEFQLYSPSDDYGQDIDKGVALGATAIEVWDTPNYSFLKYDTATLARWSAQIRQNSLP